jgi:Ankyrin repeats (3 copies)/Zinc finger, ZZ type
MIATIGGHFEVVEQLIAAKAKINDRNDRGRTALYMAAERGDVEILAALVNAGADVSLGTIAGRTPLMMAAEKGYIAAVKYLIETIKRLATSAECSTEALRAVGPTNREDVLRLLLDAAGKLNWTDEDRRAVVHEAFHCDACAVDPIKGLRYVCSSCDDYDLCEACFQKRHEIHGEHDFVVLPLSLTL